MDGSESISNIVYCLGNLVDLGEIGGGNGGNNVNTVLMYEILKEQLNKNRGIHTMSVLN